MPEAIVTVARSREAVEALRDVWSAMTITDIDSDIDYFLAVADNAEQVVSPFVVRIRRVGAPDVLVAARLENLPVRLRLAYWTFARVTVRAIVVAFGGVLGARDRDDESLAVSRLQRLLDAGAADLILMRNVDPDGALYAAVAGAAGGMRLARAQPAERVWETILPDTLEAFLAERSAKSRSSFRREEKLLRAELGDRLKLRLFRHAGEIDALCRDMAAVSARTYQAGLGAGFGDTPMERALVALGLGNGSYRCWMLYDGERPVAFWAGMGYRGVFYPATPGFDPDYSRLSVGRFTMFRMIEDLCADPSIARIAFGRGDAQYKSEYATPAGLAADVWLAAPRLWPVLVTGALSLTARLNDACRRWAGGAGPAARLKVLWRRRLARRARNGRA